MRLVARAAEVLDLLNRLGHEAALVGGLAISVRARERFTRDIDFAVAVSNDADAERLAREMQHAGFELVMLVEQEAKEVIATLRFRDPCGVTPDPTIDLVCGTCGIEPEIVAEATREKLSREGPALPVARIPHLIAMKVLSENAVRTQDRWDLQVLIQVASSEELERARQLVTLIHERGYDRELDLEERLDAFVAEYDDGYDRGR